MSGEQRTQGGGLSVKTLMIAGAASAVAALVIPALWRPGTVFAAAMTPVVVALVSELLRKPVETVSTVRVLRVAARARPGRRARETSRSTRWHRRRPKSSSCCREAMPPRTVQPPRARSPGASGSSRSRPG